MKTDRLKVGLIRASLPSYYPEKHGVWDRAVEALEELCDKYESDLFVTPKIPMDGCETARELDECRKERVDFIILLHGGFTMGDVARTLAASEYRVGFWSVPEPSRVGDVQLNNFVSLNMSMSIARIIRDLRKRPVQWYHGAPESEATMARIGNTIRALKLARSLKGARIGVVGGLAETFYNMEVSANDLQSRLGVEVRHHGIYTLTGRMAAMPDDRVDAEVRRIRASVRIDGVTDKQVRLTASCALALKDIARFGSYDALAVSDWPDLQAEPGMHPGAAFTWVEEDSLLPVASEGDVLGAATQIVSKSLTGRVGYLLDLTEPDLESGQLLVWHGGGGPLYLADEGGAKMINHPMIGRGTEKGPCFGAIVDLVFLPGPVSLFRIGRNGTALFAMTANVVPREDSGFSGCRGWLEGFRLSDRDASLEELVSAVMMHGIEHHFVLAPGDMTAPLLEFGSWTGMDTLGIVPMRDHLCAADFT